MHRLKIYVSTLGAVLLLAVVVTGVLGSIAYDFLNKLKPDSHSE